MYISNKEYGGRLKEERQRLGLSQPALAVIGGVSKGTQVGYEGGVRAPDLLYLEKVAEAGVDINFVIVGRHLDDIARDHFDWTLHDAVLDAIETWLDEADLILPFQKRMELLRYFVTYFTTMDALDVPFIHRTIKLMA